MRTVETVKRILNKYGHGLWMVAYMVFYMLGFYILENTGHRHYHVIHSMIDDLIPFCEYFIIPYLLWFAYMGIGVIWFVFRCKDKSEYYKLSCALAIGMTVFLIVSAVFPNRQDLRPEIFLDNNFFTRLVENLYKTDTPTNVLPSIHVYNTIILDIAVSRCPQLKKHKVLCTSSHVIAVLIVLSTMFLKQHSVVDVSLGILMSICVQTFCDRVFAGESSTVYGNRGYAKQQKSSY